MSRMNIAMKCLPSAMKRYNNGMKGLNSAWVRCALILVAGFFASQAMSGALELQGWSWRRPVSVAVSSVDFGQLILPPEVIDASGDDLADLRLIDANGHSVPYVLTESHTENVATGVWTPVPVLNRVIGPGNARLATIDFGTATPRNELRVQLSDRDYYREVQLEGSHDLLTWFPFSESMVLADINAAESFRLDTLRFAENNYRYLRLTVQQTPGRDTPFTINEVDARQVVDSPVASVPVAAAPLIMSTDKSGNTVVDIDLGAKHLPLTRLSVQVGDRWFYRAVAVSGRNTLRETTTDPVESGTIQVERETRWTPLTSAIVYRTQSLAGTVSARPDIVLPSQARFRYLRLTFFNQDNPPLQIQQVAVERAVTRMIFSLQPERPLFLVGGNPQAKAPRYDLEQALPGLARVTAETLMLGEHETMANASLLLPWTERHRGLLLGVLLATALILGLIVLRQLRQTPSGQID